MKCITEKYSEPCQTSDGTFCGNSKRLVVVGVNYFRKKLSKMFDTVLSEHVSVRG